MHLPHENTDLPARALPRLPPPGPEAVERANARIRTPEREVLAFIHAGLSYDVISSLMGIDARSIAELAAVARLRLHDELFASDRARRLAEGGTCLDGLAAAVARSDGESFAGSTKAILHLAGCTRCMEDLGAALTAADCYRSWVPVGPGSAFRRETLSRAALLLAHDALPPSP